MPLMESFKNIPGFDGYMISSFGRVFNLKKNTWMTHSPTENGDLTVGLMRNSHQHRRSVKRLVAESFVERPSELFDTPIHLDGNKENLNADNIVWRPRWFAWKYARQFRNELPSWAYSGPVRDIVSGAEFETIMDAALEAGILMLDIRWSLLSNRQVFPHDMIFEYVYG